VFFGCDMNIALSLIGAYSLGSIPFAYLIGRLKGVDIRKVGDGNVGAFNVFRHAGLIAGTATLVADMGKGALAVLVAKALCGEGLVLLVAGGAAVAGHNWPVFLRFRGGRGVGAIIGVLLILLPLEISITFGLTIAVLLITRNSIWCGMTLFVPLPLLCWLFGEPVSLLVYSMALPCLSALAHWLTTRHLPPEAQEEAKMFWVAPQASRGRKGTSQPR
jgi:glycerol-3-phosphate acyltransferase PlsY